jgi:alpha-1,2-mannosyltransferase
MEPLQHLEIAQSGGFVCFGKEWYRFPSSYFLPNGMRAKFIKSEFRGLLPGEFPDAPSYSGLIQGTSQIPVGMNDRNEEDLGKYVDISQCSYLVDSSFPGRAATELEPDYVHDESEWETITCTNFLDTSQSSALGRLIWVPDFPMLPARFRRSWGQYCLLKRRDAKSESK